jgi:RNA polymerase sigma-70 factor (ECF subfamily)
MMDLTQKVFMIAFTKLPQFEGRSTIATWLYAICKRVASEHRRSTVVRHEISTDPVSLAESFAEAASAPADIALARRAEVERILAKVSEEQRTVFVLYEVDELSGLEIAALLDISLGTVRSRLRHARAVFRREVRRLALKGALSMHRS